MQAANPLSSLPSPIRSRKIAPIPGFRVPPKPKPPPIEELTIRELRDLYDRNAKILATPSVDHFLFLFMSGHPHLTHISLFLFFVSLRAPSTSTYVPRIVAEQAKIEAQLLELEGMRDIQDGLELSHITEDEQMLVDKAPEQPRLIEAKLRALEKFVRVLSHFPPPSFSPPFCPPLVSFALPLDPRVSDKFCLRFYLFTNLHFFSPRAARFVNRTATRSPGYRLKKP